MIVGIVVVELQVPHARSLKDKRRAVKGIVDRIHQRYRVSVAETGYHDLLQRAELGLAVVGRSDSEVERLLDELRRMIEDSGDALLTLWSPELIEGAT